jgi:hypothetical protein
MAAGQEEKAFCVVEFVKPKLCSVLLKRDMANSHPKGSQCTTEARNVMKPIGCAKGNVLTDHLYPRTQ